MQLVKYLIRMVLISWIFSLSFFVSGQTQLSLHIDTSEGGDISNRNLAKLKKHFKQNQCNISNISIGAGIASDIASDFIFSPIENNKLVKHQQILAISTANKQPLTSSVLVRSSTSIQDLKSLQGVTIALFAEASTLGYQLPIGLFNKHGVSFKKAKITVVQTNLAAVSLLMHKDVFAAVVASPLAIKWAEDNDLSIVAQTETVVLGGVMINKEVDTGDKKACMKAFMSIYDKENISKLRRIFPKWIDSLFVT